VRFLQPNISNSPKTKFFRSYFGNFNCICNKAEEYGDCMQTMEGHQPSQNIYFMFHPVVQLNQMYRFVLVIENLGNVQSTVDISVLNDVWLNTQIPHSHQHQKFKEYTKYQLQELLKDLKLKNFDLPHEKVFAAVIPVVLTSLGSQTVKIIVKEHNKSTEKEKIFHHKQFSLMVYKTDNYCSPTVSSTTCEDYKKPREVPNHDFNVFKPIIERSCGDSSILSYQWSIDHYFEKFTYKTFPLERSSHLRTEPFTFQFDDFDDPYIGFYTVKMIVTEESVKEKQSGMKIWRVRD
jgi:hypothetical protein